MTREEAIKYGTEWLKDEYLDAKDGAFITIALETLKQEPCEDVISREAAIDACNQSVNILEATDRIKDLPSVYPKAKVGKWKRVIDNNGHLVWECQCCKWQQRIATNYCADCGAKMEREVKE